MRFVYCYWMKDAPEGVHDVAPKHAAYWRALELADYVGGPFEDRSGGLILFEAPTKERAAELALDDPFRRAGLVADWSLKTWIPE